MDEKGGGWTKQDDSYLELSRLKADLAAARARRETFADEIKLALRSEQYLVANELAKLRRRADADVQELKSLVDGD